MDLQTSTARGKGLTSKRGLLVGVAALAVILAVAFAYCWRLADAAVAPVHCTVGPPPAELPCESIALESTSGAKLACWHVPAQESRGVVVLLHPIHGSRLTMLERARLFRSAGFSLVMIDCRGHGESTGDTITLGHLEQHDARAAVDFARTSHPGEPIAVVGWSLGGAAALMASPLAIDAIVLEEVFPTIAEAIENRTRLRVGPFGPLAATILLSQLEPRLGVAADELAPIDKLSSAGCPVLLLAGAEDLHTTREQSQRMFDAAPEPKDCVFFAGAAHVDLLRHDADRYQREVLRFLDKHLHERYPAAAATGSRSDQLAPSSGASLPDHNKPSSTAASSSR